MRLLNLLQLRLGLWLMRRALAGLERADTAELSR